MYVNPTRIKLCRIPLMSRVQHRPVQITLATSQICACGDGVMDKSYTTDADDDDDAVLDSLASLLNNKLLLSDWPSIGKKGYVFCIWVIGQTCDVKIVQHVAVSSTITVTLINWPVNAKHLPGIRQKGQVSSALRKSKLISRHDEAECRSCTSKVE